MEKEGAQDHRRLSGGGEEEGGEEGGEEHGPELEGEEL